jgi:hypothetical protein
MSVDRHWYREISSIICTMAMLLGLGSQTLVYSKSTHNTVLRLLLLLVHIVLTSDERFEQWRRSDASLSTSHGKMYHPHLHATVTLPLLSLLPHLHLELSIELICSYNRWCGQTVLATNALGWLIIGPRDLDASSVACRKGEASRSVTPAIRGPSSMS